MADANGWISSGHDPSQSQSIVPQLEQKFRSDEHFASSFVPRALMALYFLCTVSSIHTALYYYPNGKQWNG